VGPGPPVWRMSGRNAADTPYINAHILTHFPDGTTFSVAITKFLSQLLITSLSHSITVRVMNKFSFKICVISTRNI